MSVTRTVLREQIKAIVLERILDGTYQPGDRLVETQIAQEFGTSQAPVRECLRDLESLRFVESQAFKGTRVRHVTRAELAEIYPVRAVLEALGAELAVRNRRDLSGAVQGEFERMLAAAEAGNAHDQVHHDVEFHRIVIEASGNATLYEVWRSLRIEARTLISLVESHMDLKMLADTHRPLVESIAGGDPAIAGRAFRDHILWFQQFLLQEESL